MLSKLLERLAEMFPKQDYQSRLNDYIASHNPQSAGDVDFTHDRSDSFVCTYAGSGQRHQLIVDYD